jgi:hypothetical protein
MIAKLRTAPQEQRLRFSLVPWEAYVAFCDGLGERYLRVTYDQGEMEACRLLHCFTHLFNRYRFEYPRILPNGGDA